MNKKILAIILVIIATFFGTLMGVFLKIAQNEINVFTAGFLRFALGLLIILPYIFYTKFKVYKTNHFKLHLLRSIINLPMMFLGFGALVYISLETFNAIHFIVPLIVTLLAVIIFKEKIYVIRISALVIGVGPSCHLIVSTSYTGGSPIGVGESTENFALELRDLIACGIVIIIIILPSVLRM